MARFVLWFILRGRFVKLNRMNRRVVVMLDFRPPKVCIHNGHWFPLQAVW